VKRGGRGRDSDGVEASSAEDAEATDEASRDGEAPSVIELLVQLGRDVSVLVFLETQLAGSRNLPEVRRTATDLSGAVIAALAFLTAFGFVLDLW
jgi:hypothetical protein